MSTDRAVAQLEDELGALATTLAAILGTDLVEILTGRARQAAPRLVAELDAGTLPDETAADLLSALWPHTDPPLHWWDTPLGLLVAPSAAAHAGEDDGWTHAQAAEVLRVTRGTVSQLVARGDLERTVDGRCTQRSVLTRLVRLSSQPGAPTARRP